MLTRRRTVPRLARVRAAEAVARAISQTHWLGPGKRIGVYASMPQELGTAPLIDLAHARGCAIYLPRITSLRSRTMRFVKIGLGSGAEGTQHARGSATESASTIARWRSGTCGITGRVRGSWVSRILSRSYRRSR